MEISLRFYEVVANLIPVLLIALAVERFVVESDGEGSSRLSDYFMAAGTVAALTLSEAVSLTVLARESSGRMADVTVVSALAVGWVLLSVAYLSKLPLERMPRSRPQWQRKMILVPMGVAVHAGGFCVRLLVAAQMSVSQQLLS